MTLHFSQSRMLTAAAASLWLVLRDPVRVGGALDAVRQHPLVSQQAGQGWVGGSDR